MNDKCYALCREINGNCPCDVGKRPCENIENMVRRNVSAKEEMERFHKGYLGGLHKWRFKRRVKLSSVS